MEEHVVSTQGLTKRYGHRIAVDTVDLQVRRGEVYGFLGPNGAGKTTTLRMLLGLVRPDAGSVRILKGRPGEPSVLRQIGALIEEPGFYPYLSGRDNLRVLARYNGIDDAQVDVVLDRVDLKGRGADLFKSYSLGMKQRLGVAAAMLGEPELLILDEPTNGLDPAGVADMRALITQVCEQGQTVLLSSHLLGEVQQTCDRVGVISNGRLLVQSTVHDLRGATAVRLRVEPVEAATEVIAREFPGTVVKQEAGGDLHVQLEASRSAELTRKLVHTGIEVHEVRPEERTLEAVFLEMTHTTPSAEVAW